MFVTLTSKHIKTQPGMELVVFTRDTSNESFPTRDDYVNGVTSEYLRQLIRVKLMIITQILKTFFGKKQKNTGLPYSTNSGT